MANIIKNIKNGEDLRIIIDNVLLSLYENGPVITSDLEILCYLKIYQPELFYTIEHRVLKYMGLHYKNLETETLSEVIFGMYQKYIREKYNISYTPVQAKIVEGIDKNQCYSFSAPTSTGKSFVFRRIIEESEKDIVIVVPSRALINEYYLSLTSAIIDKSINILTFVDKINLRYAKRNIFILTPERCKDLYKFKDEFKIEYILFDEAQLSDEQNSRGLYFDSIVRRSQRAFPDVKFIFAHPFVSNPESQIERNHFKEIDSDFDSFKIKNVGQVFYTIDKNGKYYHFGIDKSIMGKKKIGSDYDPVERVLRKNGSILIYTSKTSILRQEAFQQFSKYIDLCEIITDSEALEIIEKISQLIGGSDNSADDRYSEMIHLLKLGIVTHHGSLPLNIRVLIEEFTNKGFCKICFATSTLEQGINMPFDLVYLNRFVESKPLSIKNLIGRAGRSTQKPNFDFGEVVIRQNNMTSFRKIVTEDVKLGNVSLLEKDLPENLQDLQEFKDSILDGTFSDEFNLTPSQLEILRSIDSQDVVSQILDLLFINDELKLLSDIDNQEITKLFRVLYAFNLKRELSQGEEAIINSAVQIMIWKIYGKSFKDICFYRFSYISQKQKRDELKKINENVSQRRLAAQFTMPYAEIPNKSLKAFPLFDKNTRAIDIDYDRIVFDTYDYLDKIISFRLVDIFLAAFEHYRQTDSDVRADKMINYIKYGTDEPKEIWLLRYGFDFDDIEWLSPYVNKIDENEVIFDQSIFEESDERIKLIDRFYHTS
ncbi:DEAD/DEAH box helicase [Streptococcus merionis]|uniref:DEAD/DEAH box helicase n=1 Tax=Streptococcus merionis TaxID=400065 RepID=A0A239SV70_9STRE|nr:DEAD/DEAH box helicase [Streptococcus merionis]SNU89226.1 DEAD/DEAH box helicase [Streptococcus merionis]